MDKHQSICYRLQGANNRAEEESNKVSEGAENEEKIKQRFAKITITVEFDRFLQSQDFFLSVQDIETTFPMAHEDYRFASIGAPSATTKIAYK